MAKLSDILGMEQDRSDTASRRVIHLYQEGSFLRAYEWSAWRILAFPIERKSPMDCMVFMADIKQQIATII